MAGIREARLRDADEIGRIVCSCYDRFRETDGYARRTVAELKKKRGSLACIRDLMRNEHVLVAHDGGAIKGMISIRENEITKLFVDPRFHRQGIGRELFVCAESLIRDKGFQRMFLGAAVARAIPFYEKMGMKVMERRTIHCGPCTGMVSTILGKALDA